MTIHSALQLNSSNTGNMSYESKAILFQKLHQLKLMVVDEVSMVGSQQFQEMNTRLCKILHGDIRKNDFGGISMLLVGDLYQLPPVMQCPIFKQHKIRKPGDMAPSPWQTFILHKLTQIMHQKDIDFSNLLNVVHMKQPEQDSHEDKLLKACELKIDMFHPDYPRYALHVFATNAEVASWNKVMLDMIEGETYIYYADDSKKDKLANITNVTFPENPQQTGNLVRILKLKKGACVMLTNNIDVTDGLTNGAMGTVTGILVNENAKPEKKIKCVLVRFDSCKIGRNAIANSSHKNICKFSVLVKKIEVSFPVHGKESL